MKKLLLITLLGGFYAITLVADEDVEAACAEGENSQECIDAKYSTATNADEMDASEEGTESAGSESMNDAGDSSGDI